ncbi:metallophosphoesterase [Paenibacillus polygoni]|uniref:Metallophosphoesterase n=1 Tax=Paenibacillus polygoni TaxID=3050112 RepID=A0ABY8X8W4_9BACL|nr:metallophosphoesterase [Paenibacillus polygoni]WIV19916.1 metallophosphoesterase [Paenibacillus polygoni]
MRIALIGDLHYHEADQTLGNWVEARDAFYKNMLHHFLSSEADLYISLGDLTNLGTTSELREVYEIIHSYERRFHHVLGNHDTYTQPKKEIQKQTGQACYYSITMEDFILVFLDTTREMDVRNWGGWLDEEQLNWFEQVVQNSGTKPTLVFAHHPVYLTTTGSDREKGSIDPSIDMWRILRQKKGTGIYFNGHTHVDSIMEQNGWTFIQLSACLDQHAYRIAEITGEEVRVQAVDITDSTLADQLPDIFTYMNHFRATPHARGKQEERECSVQLLAERWNEADLFEALEAELTEEDLQISADKRRGGDKAHV